VSKLRKTHMLIRFATSADRACLATWSILDFNKRPNFRVTKLIEDFVLFQDSNINDLRIDENVVKMQRKYNLE
jgi:hypothetical protein